MATTDKNTARATLEATLNILCKQINLQANGDLKKLQSSGAPLAKTPEHHDMPVPTGLVAAYNDVSGSMDLKVDKPKVTDHGTMFIYAPAATAPANKNDWKMVHSNGHSTTIKGLTPGQNYSLSAAYKGKDGVDLIFAPAITKMAV
jgi:hypothetical protein